MCAIPCSKVEFNLRLGVEGESRVIVGGHFIGKVTEAGTQSVKVLLSSGVDTHCKVRGLWVGQEEEHYVSSKQCTSGWELLTNFSMYSLNRWEGSEVLLKNIESVNSSCKSWRSDRMPWSETPPTVSQRVGGTRAKKSV